MKRGLSVWYYRRIAAWASLFNFLDLAADYWLRIAALDPRNAQVWASLGFLKAEQGKRAEAEAFMRRALECDPNSAQTWFNLGFLRQETGDHAEAIACFERAVRGDGKIDRAWYGLAISLIKTGRLEEAIAALEKNTELQPMSPYGWYQLAHVYQRLGQPGHVEQIIRRLAGFEPKVAKQIEHETGIRTGAIASFH